MNFRWISIRSIRTWTNFYESDSVNRQMFSVNRNFSVTGSWRERPPRSIFLIEVKSQISFYLRQTSRIDWMQNKVILMRAELNFRGNRIKGQRRWIGDQNRIIFQIKVQTSHLTVFPNQFLYKHSLYLPFEASFNICDDFWTKCDQIWVIAFS